MLLVDPPSLQVLQLALQLASVLPSELAALEMHGTGTPLGDPIEVGAVLAVVRGRGQPVALSAAKSHVGHAEPAAGAVGLLQVHRHLRLLPLICLAYALACFQGTHSNHLPLHRVMAW